MTNQIDERFSISLIDLTNDPQLVISDERTGNIVAEVSLSESTIKINY